MEDNDNRHLWQYVTHEELLIRHTKEIDTEKRFRWKGERGEIERTMGIYVKKKGSIRGQRGPLDLSLTT